MLSRWSYVGFFGGDGGSDDASGSSRTSEAPSSLPSSKHGPGRKGGQGGIGSSRRRLWLLGAVVASNSLYSMRRTGTTLRRHHGDSHVKIDISSSTKPRRSFWESESHRCHRVENVCHDRREVDRWFYFAEDEGEGGANRPEPYQPSLDLPEDRGEVYFSVSSLSPKRTLEELSRCSLSDAKDHVVVHSKHNHMLGEFYSRSAISLHQIAIMAEAEARNVDNTNITAVENVARELEREEEDAARPGIWDDARFYVHFRTDPDAKLLDAHRLFLGGMGPRAEAAEWKDMFRSDDRNNATRSCRCYKRLIFCGFSRGAASNACAEGEPERARLPPEVSGELCRKGLKFDALRKLGNESLMDLALEKAGFNDKEVRRRVIRTASEVPANLALNRPATSSSNEPSAPAEMAFDGSLATRWSSEYKDGQYVQVDLGGSHLVESVAIHWETAAAKTYDLQVSADGVHWTTAHSKEGGYMGMGRVESPMNNVTCRYVRMQGYERATNFGFSIWEMEVYGTKLEPSPQERIDHDAISKQLIEMDRYEKISLVADPAVHTDHYRCQQWAPLPLPERRKICGPYSYAGLRRALARNLARKHPDLVADVDAYRTGLVRNATRGADATSNSTDLLGGRARSILGERQTRDAPGHRQLKLIGLAQRVKRRSWLNLDEVIARCNERFGQRGVLCVEVNVERLPLRGKVTPEYEQLLLHRSLDALVGVHGAQMTQAILLPENATVVELLPWAPEDYFGTGRAVWGDWTQTTGHPTPLGIIYDGSDLNHLGFSLGRDSTPLCQNVTNSERHRLQPTATELEYCLFTTHGADFRWDNRNFVVDPRMIEAFVDTFISRSNAPGNGKNVSDGGVPLCREWVRDGERNNFVLYNVWCRESHEDHASLHNFYRPGGEMTVWANL
ncbi:hypothetical protein ACHAWF_009928 [Thalassiosira exigua]